jgi:hypothetical protein
MASLFGLDNKLPYNLVTNEHLIHVRFHCFTVTIYMDYYDRQSGVAPILQTVYNEMSFYLFIISDCGHLY